MLHCVQLTLKKALKGRVSLLDLKVPCPCLPQCPEGDCGNALTGVCPKMSKNMSFQALLRQLQHIGTVICLFFAFH